MNRIYLFAIVLIILVGCKAESAKPTYVASSHPAYAILKEICGTKADVERLVPPGASPHTYAPKPSDIFKAESALALFYISDNLDAWVNKLGNDKKIEMIKLLPLEHIMHYEMHNHEHDSVAGDHSEKEKESEEIENIDPHFWTDPLTVKELLPALVDTLSKLDPDNAVSYQNNADRFGKRLVLLDKQVSKMLRKQRGKQVFLFHPSFNYFLKRYNLRYAGSLEPIPGKEPTAESMKNIIAQVKAANVKSIFSEPQLPEAPADVIAESAGVSVFTLDPVGGANKKVRYVELILFNAKIFEIAL